MIPASSLSAIQKGIYNALTQDATLAAAVKLVADAVPDPKPYPLIVIGDALETPDRTMGQGGHEVLALVTVYTRDGGTDRKGQGTTGYKQAQDLVERVAALLVGTTAVPRTLTLTGFDLVDCEVDTITLDRESDGITRVADARFRLYVETQPAPEGP